ncbi:MAG: type II and III secretion system protein family protein [Alphaproteobacteria bacterium]
MLHFRSYRGLQPILGLGAFCLVFVASQLFAQQQTAPTITVTVNKSMVFRLAQKAKRVSVSQPQVADVVVVAPSQLLINGKAIGTTSLIVFDEKGEVTNYDLIVTPDIGALRAQLRIVLPNERVEVSTSGPALVLRGEVSNEVVYDKVLEIAQSYLPPKPPAAVAPSSTNTVAVSTQKTTLPTSGTGFAGGGQIAFDDQPSLSAVDRWSDKAKIEGIIDLLVIREVRQIELDVIVAEVATQKLREIGFDFLLNTKHVSATIPNAVQSAIQQAAQGIFAYTSRGFSLTTLYRLLQNRDVTEILAQPRLVMKNGRSGGFLAGGEFPVVQTLQNSFGVEFKPFGVRLDFVPTLTWSDRIDLRVFPEVSDIDESVSVQGVPGLKVRRTVNRVELNEGESLVIGGLLDRRILKDLTKFPLLGDIPILGALFRSTRFRNQESELVFVITPRIVSAMKPGEKPHLPSVEKYDDPDIRQVPLPGSSEEKKTKSQGATIP